ncbi:uncharacterized protein DMENIID0001_016930 [Sergentomyia squamirostris]
MWRFIVIAVTLFSQHVYGVNLVAYISQFGLHGEIHFSLSSDYKRIQIETKLETTLQYPDQIWSWSIHLLPVDYSDPNPRRRCEAKKLGTQILFFDDALGYLTLPGNETSKWQTEFTLTGDRGLWGKSLLLSNPNTGFRICATITTRDSSLEHIAEARFIAPVAGSVYFRWLAAKETDHADTLIYSNLYHVRELSRKTGNAPFTQHIWKIYVTDILNSDNERLDENCNILQLVFDPGNRGDGKSIGDIDSRLGMLKIATNPHVQELRILFRDDSLVLLPSDITGPQRQLYLVLFDSNNPENFLACAKIRHVKPRKLKTFINGGGLKGEITISQRSRFDPTWLNFTMSAASNDVEANLLYARNVASFRITTLPPSPIGTNETTFCPSGGPVYNPTNLDMNTLPPPGFGTQEQYPVGDLTGKLQNRSRQEEHNFYIPGASSELSGIYWDVFLPLEGPNSVAHRGLSVQRFNRSQPNNITEDVWTCGFLTYYHPMRDKAPLPMTTAEILFRYPIVGRVLLRQPQDEPLEDTAIIFEYLIHADGSALNNTMGHRWAIHDEPPGKDFYNWTGRCLSTEEVYNPYKVNFNEKSPGLTCTNRPGSVCRLGDMWNRLGTLDIAGSLAEAQTFSRKLFIDRNLPLSGVNNIMGKSLVIYDDFGPKARGERLACAKIGSQFRRKAVARDWYSNGELLSVAGKLEMIQQSEYDVTGLIVELKGLSENSGYHVHMTPVESDLEFPCEDSTLYGHWNPRKIDPKTSPPPGTGSTDQYEMGDFSGKFGTLDGLYQKSAYYNDTLLPLYGYESVLGRSIVIHKKEKNLRWACSTIERGYSPSEAREIRAIASFHHPAGYAYGYIRFTQLIGTDGSQSDTIIEANLQYPGKNDRNISYNHHWQVYVNPVGVDAAVQTQATRCVAGGYVWNPYYTQLADPLNEELYRQECGPNNPLRCYVGDVSARLGPIDIGNKRQVFTDPNLPLEGTETAVGRSIVIFGPNFAKERFACANIEPDHDIVKFINIQKPPRFVVAQFLEDVRHVMGVPKWMLSIDSRKTKTLHAGACVQMIIHFKGAEAHKLEQDFSRLIGSGRLDAPSIYIPGFVNTRRKKTLSYKVCGVRDPNERSARPGKLAESGQMKLQYNSILVLLCAIITKIFSIS